MLLRNQKNNVQNGDIQTSFQSFRNQILNSGRNPQDVLNEMVSSGKVNKQQLDRATKLARMYSWLIR